MESKTLYEFNWDADGDTNEDNLQWAYGWLKERWDGDPVLVDGRLGLWNGSQQVSGLFRDLRDAIRSMNPTVITVEGCKVMVEYHHQDGVNRFELRQLTAKGVKWLDRQPYSRGLGVYASHLIDTKGYSRNFIKRGE